MLKRKPVQTPSFKEYSGQNIDRAALPLGGTGTVSLGGRSDLRDWEIMSRPGKGYPFGQVHLNDRDFPHQARVDAFNPLVPGDIESSSLPVAAPPGGAEEPLPSGG